MIKDLWLEFDAGENASCTYTDFKKWEIVSYSYNSNNKDFELRNIYVAYTYYQRKLWYVFDADIVAISNNNIVAHVSCSEPTEINVQKTLVDYICSKIVWEGQKPSYSNVFSNKIYNGKITNVDYWENIMEQERQLGLENLGDVSMDYDAETIFNQQQTDEDLRDAEDDLIDSTLHHYYKEY